VSDEQLDGGVVKTSASGINASVGDDYAALVEGCHVLQLQICPGLDLVEQTLTHFDDDGVQDEVVLVD
jgi:hypothetical protein